jgi:cytochrome b
LPRSVIPPGKEAHEVKVRVWDLPVRIFHWLLVALLAFSWWSAENDRLDWHFLSGYAILALVIFRVYWGFAGSWSARFAAFAKGPRAVIGYLGLLPTQAAAKWPGHNPMGGWSVLAMLALLLVQVGLGLFAIDVDGLNAGPLDYLVAFDTGRLLAGWHARVFNVLLTVIGLHIAAIAFYAIFKRENLARAMVTGTKQLPPAIVPAGTRLRPVWWALPGLVLGALIVAAILFVHY